MPLWLLIALFVFLYLAICGAALEMRELKDKINRQQAEIIKLKKDLETYKYNSFFNSEGF